MLADLLKRKTVTGYKRQFILITDGGVNNTDDCVSLGTSISLIIRPLYQHYSIDYSIVTILYSLHYIDCIQLCKSKNVF